MDLRHAFYYSEKKEQFHKIKENIVFPRDRELRHKSFH